MRQSPLKQLRASQIVFLLTLAAVTTLGGCKACTVSEEKASLTILGEGECTYQAAVGQQSIDIDVKGTSALTNQGNHWTDTVSNDQTSTYPIQVPSKGSYKVNVTVTETSGNSVCSPCINLCGTAVTKPTLTGFENFNGFTAAGTVKVSLPANPTKVNCGC